MAEKIYLREIRMKVDDKYVGFKPNGGSIKPVHIAGGSLRSIYGASANTKAIKMLSYVENAKGITPKGNELDTVFNSLIEDERLEDEISKADLESLRNVMQRLLDVDKAVYSGEKDGMVSYSAGSKYFLTKPATYEDTGEFIGGVIKEYCPRLSEYIKKLLDNANDPISLLFSPVTNEDMEIFERSRHVDIPAFKEKTLTMDWYIEGIKVGGECLTENFEKHSNPLSQMRIFNFFCIFQVMRYLSTLEAFYCGEKARPILLDFSGLAPSQSSVARASEMSYTQMHKAINRFYAWGFAKELEEFSIAELMESETPAYERNKESKTGQNELDTLWSRAKERAEVCSNDAEKRLVFGETIYSMLALEASSYPVNCIKILGTSAGVLYPPDEKHPNKRFFVSQDVLEMLLRACVEPNEVITGMELRERLWERFGIVVGGSSFEIERLQSNGMIMQVDEDALEENFSGFAKTLESMDFAEEMADGILQIRLGGAE